MAPVVADIITDTLVYNVDRRHFKSLQLDIVLS